MSHPVFSPFVMDKLSRQGRLRNTPMVVVPRRVRVVHVPYEKPNGLFEYQKKVNVIPNEVESVMGTRKAYSGIGNGEVLGKGREEEEGFSFVKSAMMIPPKHTKRVYYPTDEEMMYMERGGKERGEGIENRQREMKTYRVDKPKMYTQGREEKEVVDMDGSVDVLEEVDEVDREGLMMRREIDERARGMEREKTGTVTIIKQLAGENHYLKDQLDAAMYKNKQLEMLLLDRSVHIKQLLKDNLQLGCKLRRFIAEMGEDAADEILNPK